MTKVIKLSFASMVISAVGVEFCKASQNFATHKVSVPFILVSNHLAEGASGREVLLSI